jgi:hypothetical protein
MTPKEKAIELTDSFYVLLDGNVTFEQVKQCAFIAVEEILNNWKDEANIQFPYGKVINYWNIVKEQIEKL